MKTIVVGLGIYCVCVLTGCGAANVGSPSDDEGGGSCPAELEYAGRTYIQTPHDKPLHRAGKVGRARFTDCFDGSPDQDARVTIWRLRGMDVATGFGAAMANETLFYVSEEVIDPCLIPITRC